MPTEWKNKCLAQIAQTIEMPRLGYAVVNHTSFRIAYRVEGRLRYLVAATPEEGATLLKRHGLIDDWCIIDQEVKMYRRHLVSSAGARGEVMWLQWLSPCYWADIEITPEVALQMAVQHEYDQAQDTMSNVKAAVRHLAGSVRQLLHHL